MRKVSLFINESLQPCLQLLTSTLWECGIVPHSCGSVPVHLPRWVRVEHYRYSYTKIGSKAARRGVWWKRKRIGSYLPPLSLQALEPYLRNYGWPVPRLPTQSLSGKEGRTVEVKINSEKEKKKEKMQSKAA